MITLVSWFLLGSAVSLVCLVSQWWSIHQLQPAQPVQGMILVTGGATLRWLLVTGLFMLAIQAGLLSLSIVFFGYWSGRWAGLYWLGYYADKLQ